MFQIFWFWLSAHPGPIQVSKFNIHQASWLPEVLKPFTWLSSSEGRDPSAVCQVLWVGLGSLLEEQYLLMLQRSGQADKAFHWESKPTYSESPPAPIYVVSMLNPWLMVFNLGTQLHNGFCQNTVIFGPRLGLFSRTPNSERDPPFQ